MGQSYFYDDSADPEREDLALQKERLGQQTAASAGVIFSYLAGRDRSLIKYDIRDHTQQTRGCKIFILLMAVISMWYYRGADDHLRKWEGLGWRLPEVTVAIRINDQTVAFHFLRFHSGNATLPGQSSSIACGSIRSGWNVFAILKTQ